MAGALVAHALSTPIDEPEAAPAPRLILPALPGVAGYGNENLLLLSPLCLFLLPGGCAKLRGREPSARFRAVLVAVAACAVLAGFLKFLPFRPQQNVEWVLLLLPLHWALLRAFAPKR